MTPEIDILSRTELARPELLALRRGKFSEGEHWVTGERRKILWTDAGIKALSGHFGVPESDLTGGRETGRGVVMWANYANRTLVQVMPAGGDAPIRMKVRDARLYVPGMEVEYGRTERGWVESRRPRTRGRF